MAVRPHTFVIGGQPDYLSLMAETGWQAHGRELAVGDAEKVLDLAPSVRYRAPSPGSGEFYFEMNYSGVISGPSGELERGIFAAVHNLQDVAAKARVLIGTGEKRYPTTTISTTNSTSTYADVDQNPHGTIVTRAGSTVAASDWSINVGGFATGGYSLNLAVEDSQVLFVRMRATGTHTSSTPPPNFYVWVRETATTRATKQVYIRLGNGESIIVAVLLDPNDWTLKTLANMRVEVGATGTGTGSLRWECESICWLQVPAMGTGGVYYDSGWQSADEGSEELHYMASETQVASVIPYLDADGVLDPQTYPLLSALFYWDESFDDPAYSTYGRPRIFEQGDTNTAGTLTGWRPEIGVMVEGPAYGTEFLARGNQFSADDLSIVRISKGGHKWVIRRESPRRLRCQLPLQDAESVVPDLLSVLRRAGQSRPFAVAVRPDVPTIAAAMSIYGTVRWSAGSEERTSATENERAASDPATKDRFAVSLDVEESL